MNNKYYYSKYDLIIYRLDYKDIRVLVEVITDIFEVR